MSPTPRVCQLVSVTVGEVVVARFQGPRVFLDEGAAEAAGGQLFKLADDMHGGTLLLDLGDVAYLNSTALDKLLLLHRRLRDADGQLVLYNVPPRIHALFELTCLSEVLTVRQADSTLIESQRS